MLRFILSIVFIVSGIAKLYNIQNFATEVALYGDYYVASWVVKWRMELGIIVCLTEISIGIFAFKTSFSFFVNCVFLLMLSLFLYLTGRNYFFPPLTGSIESCGCFGELIHFSPQMSFYKTLVLWGMALLNIGLIIKRRSSN